MNKNKFIFCIIFIYLSQVFSYDYSYITFDLKKYNNNSINYDQPSDLIKYNLYSLYYTDIIFGSQEKNYLMQISLDDYEFDLTNYKCEIASNYTTNFFDPFLSQSSIVETSGINFTYYGLNAIYRITDHIKLNKNNTLNYIYPKIIFFFNPRNYSIAKTKTDFSPFTCFKLGMRLPSENYYSYEDYYINIMGQLYRKKIINSYEWFIEYNNEENPKLIIGTSPYEYNPNKYIYNNSRSIRGLFFSGNFYYWNLEFNQIYFLVNNKREQFDYRKCSLEPSFNYIKAPFYYFQIINETLFDDLIKQKKCFINEVKKNINVYCLYYCLNKEDIKQEIKNKFLNINLLHRFLSKEFVIDYNDVFLEKNNKIYFLIIYDNMIRTNWILGKPFLNKYFFSFNYNEKILTFYEMDKEENKEEKNKEEKNKKEKNIENNKEDKTIIYVIIIIILIIIFSLLGFFLAKFIYSHYKKRKATELLNDDDFIKNNNYENSDKKIIEPIMDNNSDINN